MTNLEFVKNMNVQDFVNFHLLGCPPNMPKNLDICLRISSCKECWLNWLNKDRD